MLHAAEKQKVIEAIGELGRRVTVADVITKTGLPVLVASRLLNEVAADTGGHLQVSSRGEIAYQFAPGFSGAYVARGIKGAIQQGLAWTGKVALFLLKISFGLMLILSIIAVCVLIIVISLSGNRDDRRRDVGFNFHFSYWDFALLRNLFVYSAGWMIDDGYGRPRRKRNSNFLLNCFSFLFGDGNPNFNIEDRRWGLLAESIRANNYVMTVEQMAPYTGLDPGKEDNALAVLARFNGHPEVTEDGQLIYVFPEMQATAGQRRQLRAPEPYLKEFELLFSESESSDLIPVYILAAVNFFGSWFVAAKAASTPGAEYLLVFAIPLVIYGTLFVLTPLIRMAIQAFINARIRRRNEIRQKYAEELQAPSSELAKKLAVKNNFSLKSSFVSEDKLEYTTEKAALEQSDELDKKFKKLESDRNFDVSP